jgi:nonribosomal peptide synthetase protein BlmVI
VLDVRPIGASDNFVELGGDSFRAVQLVRAARERGIFFTVSELLTSTCLGEFAAKAQLDREAS